MNPKTIIIAEAGVNHNGSVALAKKLIDVAADAGADFVKFQTYKTENLVSRSARKADYQLKKTNEFDDLQFNMLKNLELSKIMHEELMAYSNLKGIAFLSTAFDIESLVYLDSINIPIIKIASGEITNLPYLRYIGGLRKKVFLSTGMSTLGEIETALEILTSAGTRKDQIIVFHCNTEYPSPFEDVNLNAMLTIRDSFGVCVGYSDHTRGIEVPIAAVALGASAIEKHFTLDRNLEGPDHKASLEPAELKQMVQAIRNIEKSLGDGIKRPSESEKKNMIIARKSLHYSHDLAKGSVISEKDISIKRPGDGLPPSAMEFIIGKTLHKDVAGDTKIKPEDLN